MLGQQIYECRRRKKIGQKVLAERMGVSTSLISAWERGTRTPSEEQIKELDILLDASLSAGPRSIAIKASSTLIPIRGKVWASPFRLSSPAMSLKSVRVLASESNCYALEVEGNSMLPAYRHGDVIVCRPRHEVLSPFVADDEGAYVPIDKYAHLHNRDCIVTLNGETWLKRIVIEQLDGLKWTMKLVSLNPDHPEVVVRYGDEFRCEAVVVRNVLPELPE